MDGKRFYLVWSPTGIYAPKYRHGTQTAATTEAERLAKECPGQQFFVMAALSLSSVPPITNKLTRDPEDKTDDDIPF